MEKQIQNKFTNVEFKDVSLKEHFMKNNNIIYLIIQINLKTNAIIVKIFTEIGII